MMGRAAEGGEGSVAEGRSSERLRAVGEGSGGELKRTAGER